MRNVSIYIAAKELALVTKGKMQSRKASVTWLNGWGERQQCSGLNHCHQRENGGHGTQEIPKAARFTDCAPRLSGWDTAGDPWELCKSSCYSAFLSVTHTGTSFLMMLTTGLARCLSKSWIILVILLPWFPKCRNYRHVLDWDEKQCMLIFNFYTQI